MHWGSLRIRRPGRRSRWGNDGNAHERDTRRLREISHVEAKDSILVRMYVVLTALSLLPLLILGQIFRIHLTEGRDLRDQGRRQTNSFVSIPAMRGAIHDRAGRTLAVNTARYDLALDPTVSGFDEQQHTFFERLSKLTGTSSAYYRQRVRERTSPQYVQLVRGMPERQKEEVERWDVPGVILDPAFARRYNHGPTASHVLGYVSPEGSRAGRPGIAIRRVFERGGRSPSRTAQPAGPDQSVRCRESGRTGSRGVPHPDDRSA